MQYKIIWRNRIPFYKFCDHRELILSRNHWSLTVMMRERIKISPLLMIWYDQKMIWMENADMVIVIMILAFHHIERWWPGILTSCSFLALLLCLKKNTSIELIWKFGCDSHNRCNDVMQPFLATKAVDPADVALIFYDYIPEMLWTSARITRSAFLRTAFEKFLQQQMPWISRFTISLRSRKRRAKKVVLQKSEVTYLQKASKWARLPK